MGHEAATRAPFIQLYSHPPHTAVQPTQIRTSERVLRPPQGVNTPPKDYTIQPSHRPIMFSPRPHLDRFGPALHIIPTQQRALDKRAGQCRGSRWIGG